MERKRFYTPLIVSACLGLGLSNMASAQTPEASGREARDQNRAPAADVTLSPSGVLAGHVVDQQGRPLGHNEVAVYRQGREIARARSDAEGRFEVAGMTSGVYVIQAAGTGTAGLLRTVSSRQQTPAAEETFKTNPPRGTESVYRVWNPQLAPPLARNAAVIVADGPVVRGQIGGLTPAVVGGTVVIGATIVGGVLIFEEIDDNDDPPASP